MLSVINLKPHRHCGTVTDNRREAGDSIDSIVRAGSVGSGHSRGQTDTQHGEEP